MNKSRFGTGIYTIIGRRYYIRNGTVMYEITEDGRIMQPVHVWDEYGAQYTRPVRGDAAATTLLRWALRREVSNREFVGTGKAWLLGVLGLS